MKIKLFSAASALFLAFSGVVFAQGLPGASLPYYPGPGVLPSSGGGGAPSGPAGGDLSGTYPNPLVASIGGKSIALGGALTTTGTGAISLAFPNTTATYTFPSSSATLMNATGGNATSAALQALATNAGSANLSLGGFLGVGPQGAQSGLLAGPIGPLDARDMSGAATSTIQHINLTAASTSNQDIFDHRLLSSTMVRTAFEIITSFSTTADASRAALVRFRAAANGSLSDIFALAGSHFLIGTTTDCGVTLCLNGGVSGGGRIVSGTSDTPAVTDCGQTIHFTSGSGITVTMPASITVECTMTFVQEGAGQITFAAASGATIHSAHSYTKTFGQWAIVDMVWNTGSGANAVYTLAGDGA